MKELLLEIKYQGDDVSFYADGSYAWSEMNPAENPCWKLCNDKLMYKRSTMTDWHVWYDEASYNLVEKLTKAINNTIANEALLDASS